jgi:5-(carboxyamino)imidazole ribonucleotide mutase
MTAAASRSSRRAAGTRPLVGVIMGSRADWDTMRHTAATLAELRVPYETAVVSAHRTPARLAAYTTSATGRGLEVLIAGAGGAAHLPGMAAAHTLLPVLGVPISSSPLAGFDALLSIVQMPAGVPVATQAIGRAGAINAAVLAASILALRHVSIRRALARYRRALTAAVLAAPDPEASA